MNLLDLGLGHLGVEVGRAERQVEALVKACGQSKVPYGVSGIDYTTDLHVVSVGAAGHFVSITRREGSYFGLRT